MLSAATTKPHAHTHIQSTYTCTRHTFLHNIIKQKPLKRHAFMAIHKVGQPTTYQKTLHTERVTQELVKVGHPSCHSPALLRVFGCCISHRGQGRYTAYTGSHGAVLRGQGGMVGGHDLFWRGQREMRVQLFGALDSEFTLFSTNNWIWELMLYNKLLWR